MTFYVKGIIEMLGYSLIRTQDLANMQEMARLDKELHQTNDELIKTLKETIAALSEKATNTTVCITFDESYQVVTPYITYNKDQLERLVERKVLQYSQIEDKFAVELAHIMLAEDALHQIVDSYTEELKEE